MNTAEEKQKQLNECRKACEDIFKNTLASPKEWITDYLELEEKGEYVRVYVTLGGPTVWWSFNTAKKTGRLYYHHGSACSHKDFGHNTYEKLIAVLY